MLLFAALGAPGPSAIVAQPASGASGDGGAPPSFDGGGAGATPPSGGASAGVGSAAPSAQKPPEAKEIDDARARMERGQRLFAEGAFAQATDEFVAAYDKHKFNAFLFNAAVAAERSAQRGRAIELYERFLKAEPSAPDKADIDRTVERLKQENAAAPEASASSQKAEIKSLVFVESDPSGAPVSIYERIDPKAPLLDPKNPNTAGYRRVQSGLTTPANLSLNVGTYFLLVEGFRDYNSNGSQFTFEAGRVYVYRAGLSQGDFVGRVEVSVPVTSAQIYVDDPPPHRAAPRAVGTNSIELAPGPHDLYIEALGFEKYHQKIEVVQGKVVKVDAKLERVRYGYLLVSGDAELVEVEVDGEEIGVFKRKSGERLRIRVPSGSHEIEIDADGRKAFDTTVSIPRGQEITVDAKLEDSPGKGGAVASTILAAASLAGGVVLNRYVAGLPEGDDLKDPLNGVSIGCFAGAGVFAALSVFLFVYDPGDDSTAKISIPREFTGEAEEPAVKPRRLESAGPRVRHIGLMAAPSASPSAFVGPLVPAGLIVSGSF